MSRLFFLWVYEERIKDDDEKGWVYLRGKGGYCGKIIMEKRIIIFYFKSLKKRKLKEAVSKFYKKKPHLR